MNRKKFEEILKGIENTYYPLASSTINKYMKAVVKHAKNVLTLIDFNAFKTYLEKTLRQYAGEVSSIVAKAMGRGCGDIKKILDTNWSGKLYSERIWNNTAKLKKRIEKEVMNVVLGNQDIETAIRAIEERFGVSYSEAKRLITTETNYAMNQKEKYAAMAEGYTHYKYSAILDSRTTEVCRNLHGKVFSFEEAVVGVNFPPLLPNCRSTIKPIKKSL